ncbi:hypothetical protein L195_g061158, partial [Trifolium pratense]
MTPHLQLQTPDIDITTNNNTQVASSVVGCRPQGRPPSSKNKSKIPIVRGGSHASARCAT